MSISNNPVITNDLAQHSMQPLQGNSAQRAASDPAGVGLKQSEAAAVTKPDDVLKSGDAIDAVKPNAAQTRQSLQDINRVLTGLSISVQFQIDPNFKDVIVKVVDQDSGKLIRQIPSEDVVRIAKAMDNLKGLLFAQAV